MPSERLSMDYIDEFADEHDPRPAHRTNLDVVSDLMNFARNGPMMQAFIMQALEVYAKHVIANADKLPDDKNSICSNKLWVACAQEVADAIEAHLRQG